MDVNEADYGVIKLSLWYLGCRSEDTHVTGVVVVPVVLTIPSVLVSPAHLKFIAILFHCIMQRI